MLTRNTTYVGRPNFIKDPYTVMRTGGRQIDWSSVDDDYKDATSGKKVIPAGTAMGILLSANDKQMSPRVDTTNPAVGLLEGDAVEDSLTDSLSGYGLIIGATVYENLLPDAAGGPPAVLDSNIKDELEAACPRGFHYVMYEDSRIP